MGVFVAVAAVAITMMVARTAHDPAGLSADPDPKTLGLKVDPRIDPPVVTAGGRFRYRFQVTNSGDLPLRNIAVRSEKVLDGRPPQALRMLSVSDRTCVVNGWVSCLFPELPPGGSRSVQVDVLAVRPRRPGDQVMIRTFVGCFVPDPAGGVDFSVVGEGKDTVGRFAMAVSRPVRSGGHPEARRDPGRPRHGVPRPGAARQAAPRAVPRAVPQAAPRAARQVARQAARQVARQIARQAGGGPRHEAPHPGRDRAAVRQNGGRPRHGSARPGAARQAR